MELGAYSYFGHEKGAGQFSPAPWCADESVRGPSGRAQQPSPSPPR